MTTEINLRILCLYLRRLIFTYIENNGFLDAFVKMKHLLGIYLCGTGMYRMLENLTFTEKYLALCLSNTPCDQPVRVI